MSTWTTHGSSGLRWEKKWGCTEREKRGWSPEAFQQIYQGENATRADVFGPGSRARTPQLPLSHLHCLFYSLSPLIYFCLSAIDWFWFLFAAGWEAGLLNRTLQTHTHDHILTRLHSPLSLTYTQPHSLREGRAIISLQLALPPSLSLSLFLRNQNMSSTHKSDGLGLQMLDLNWTHLWNPQSARNENKGPATR